MSDDISMEAKITEMHEKVGLLFDRLYGQNGHKGDIPELKEQMAAAMEQCNTNRTDLAKLKAYIAGAAAAAVGGLGTALKALFS